ncbi:unnamed protein product [Rotaria sp. Silwood1]|nr:unnamed protein product [Rotaria sp. Silwood1]CAF3649525.1 unnamed protein product [Rotaria sp. Silwood1]CAF4529707.1 unnamed protein product [Rotaria sp. Silwood1]
MFTTTHPSSGGASNFSQALASEARLNRLHRLFKTHFNVTEPSLVLDPYLFLGNCISAQDIHRLSRLGIRYILNVAKRDVELCPYYPNDMRTLTIDLRDDDRENILRAFDQAFAFIDEARRTKSRILVHCSHGQSRSPAIVIGYLMRTYNVSLEQCLVHVVKARPCVIPNDGFLKQLIVYDRFLIERRRQQQGAAAMQTVKTALPTEIPIQHHLPIASQSVKPPASATIAPAQHPTIPVSNAANTSSVKSSIMESSSTSSMGLASKPSTRLPSTSSVGVSSTSNIKSSSSTNSIHVIPIQIETKESTPEKSESVQCKEVSRDDDTGDEDTHQTDIHSETKPCAIKQPPTENSKRLKPSSSHNLLIINNRSSKPKTNDIKQVPNQIPRSKTDDLGRLHANQHHHNQHHHNQHHLNQHHLNHHSSYFLTQEQWNVINNMPTSYHGFNQHRKTNYITEIYDRATKQFVQMTCY